MVEDPMWKCISSGVPPDFMHPCEKSRQSLTFCLEQQQRNKALDFMEEDLTFMLEVLCYVDVPGGLSPGPPFPPTS